jgi:hypothetical protein
MRNRQVVGALRLQQGRSAVPALAETKPATLFISPLRALRSLAALGALAMGLLLSAAEADTRFEDGMVYSGGGTFLLPSVRAAAAARPAVIATAMPASAGQQQTYPGGSLGGLFNRPGLIGGFAAGFLGAGLFGLLFGHGMVGELSGVASVLGLLFQIALIAMLLRLIWTWWQAGNVATFADRSPRQLADAYGRPRHEALPNIDAGAATGQSENDAFNC